VPAVRALPTAHINLHTANWSRWAAQLPIQLRRRNVEVLSNDVSLRSEWAALSLPG